LLKPNWRYKDFKEAAKVSWLFNSGKIVTGPKNYSNIKIMPKIINPLEPIEFDEDGNEVVKDVSNQRIKEITLFQNNPDGTNHFTATLTVNTAVEDDGSSEAYGTDKYVINGKLSTANLTSRGSCAYTSFKDSEISPGTLEKYRGQISLIYGN
jgi:hypothetical protein